MKKISAFLLSLQLFIFPLVCFAGEKSNIVVNGFNQFGFTLFQQVSKPDENLVLSPYSLSSALSMLISGSAGITQKELMKLLHVENINSQDLTSELNSINVSLKTATPCNSWASCKILKMRKWIGNAEAAENFNIANALWADKNFTYKPAFISETKKNSTVHFNTVDFRNQPDIARETINHWVEEQTNNYIKNLLPQGMITKDTSLILTNAIYFKGLWEFAFDKDKTQPQSFTLASGNEIQVPMMQQENDFLYTENNTLQMLQLPYKNSFLAMAILLPKGNHSVKEIFSTLTNENFLHLLQSSIKKEVTVIIPKFKFASTYSSLDEVLKNMGLHTTFTDKADFSNMTDDKLILSQVIQKAYIEVDEEGTKAAAATAIIGVTAFVPENIVFNANHPFIFIIFDTKSKIIIFMGQVMNPSLISGA